MNSFNPSYHIGARVVYLRGVWGEASVCYSMEKGVRKPTEFRKASEFRKDIWRSWDIFVVIAKWVVLIDGFPDEGGLDMLKCVSKFLRGFIDTNLRTLLRKSCDYVDNIVATQFTVFHLNFKMEDGDIKASMCNKTEHMFSNQVKATSYGNTFFLNKRNRFMFSLQEGYEAIFLELENDAKTDLNFFPFEFRKYRIFRGQSKKSKRDMFHGEFVFVVEEQSGVVKLAILFMERLMSEYKDDSKFEDLKRAITAIGMCLRKEERGWQCYRGNFHEMIRRLKAAEEDQQ